MIVRPEKWIKMPDEEGNGLLLTWVVSGSTAFPLPMETHHVAMSEVEMEKEREYEVILECVRRPEIYLNEEAFRNSGEHSSMSPESVIPMGLFAAKGQEDYGPTPRILLNGRIVKTYEDAVQYGFGEGDVLYTLSCLDNHYDAVLYSSENSEISISEGNYVSCEYWVHGWPKEE